MIRRFLGGPTMRARCVGTGVVATGVAGCGGARSLGGSDEGALLRETGGGPTGAPTRAERSPDPSRAPREAGPASAAALNLRLMEQAARSSEESDLPVGTGDLLEISVFEVEELSKIRLRVPGRGDISLPLIGQIQATGRTTAELEEEMRARPQRSVTPDPQ